MPKLSQGCLTPDQATAFLAHAPNVRDRALFVVLLETGMTVAKKFEKNTWAEVVAAIPSGAVVSGKIVLPDGFEFRVPAAMQLGHTRIRQANGVLTLDWVLGTDVAQLQMPTGYVLDTRQLKLDLDTLKRQQETRVKLVAALDKRLWLLPSPSAERDAVQLQKFQAQNDIDGDAIRMAQLADRLGKRALVFAGEWVGR
ncbi:MAG: hypothetical protein AAB066_04310 [Candidatus Margulisiibacteriota bacterium]